MTAEQAAEPSTWTTELGDRVVVWESAPGDWRWHVTARNGEVLEQGEGHTRREDAVRAAVRYHPASATAGRRIPINPPGRVEFVDPAGATEAGQDGEAEDKLRDALRVHHPIMRSETGPFSGCRCGQVGLGQDVIAHVAAEVRAALAGMPDPAADPMALPLDEPYDDSAMPGAEKLRALIAEQIGRSAGYGVHAVVKASEIDSCSASASCSPLRIPAGHGWELRQRLLLVPLPSAPATGRGRRRDPPRFPRHRGRSVPRRSAHHPRAPRTRRPGRTRTTHPATTTRGDEAMSVPAEDPRDGEAFPPLESSSAWYAPPASGRGDTDSGAESFDLDALRAEVTEDPDALATYEAARRRTEAAARSAGDRAQPTQEVREAVRRLLFWGVDTGKAAEAADAVLALPEVVDLLDAQAAVNRVEALVEEWDANGLVPMGHYATRAVRRALDGTT